MSYADKFDREVELVDMTDAQELAVKMIMKEGELSFRDALIASLKSELASLEAGPATQNWIDGVNYCIHLISNGDFDVNERGA